jgi:CheY-like chemotaxis protein
LNNKIKSCPEGNLKYKVNTILYIDDDDDDVFLFEQAVASVNGAIKFFGYSSGVDALQSLKESRIAPDIIFVDVNMPLMDGFDFLQEVKNADGLMKEIPVIMISTSNSEKDMYRAAISGAESFITKPHSYQGLCQILKEVVD